MTVPRIFYCLILLLSGPRIFPLFLFAVTILDHVAAPLALRQEPINTTTAEISNVSGNSAVGGLVFGICGVLIGSIGICITVVKYLTQQVFVEVIPNGDDFIGSSFKLKCFVKNTLVCDKILAYTWKKKEGEGISKTVTRSNNDIKSILVFDKLKQEDRGEYFCECTIRRCFLCCWIKNPKADLVSINVTCPKIHAVVEGQDCPTKGEFYKLRCKVTISGAGAENIDQKDDLSYMWFKKKVILNNASSTYTWDHFGDENVGSYKCKVTSNVLKKEITTEKFKIKNMKIPQILSSLTERNSPIIGTDYSLTCTVYGAGNITTDSNCKIEYEWFSNGEPLNHVIKTKQDQDLTSCTLNISPLKFCHKLFACRVTISFGTLQSSIVVQDCLKDIPKIDPEFSTEVVLTPKDNPALLGGDYTFECIVTCDFSRSVDMSTFAYTFQLCYSGWSKPWVQKKSPAETASYRLENFNCSDAGRYIWKVTVHSSTLNEDLELPQHYRDIALIAQNCWKKLSLFYKKMKFISLDKSEFSWESTKLIKVLLPTKNNVHCTYNEIFNEAINRKRVLLEGITGAGKSTLIQALSRDWAEGAEKMISKIKDNEDNGSEDDVYSKKLTIMFSCQSYLSYSVHDIVRHSCHSLQEEECKYLCASIDKNNGRGFLFLCDGLDEYLSNREEYYNPFKNIIRGTKADEAILIASSRPGTEILLQAFKKESIIQVVGFEEDGIKAYLKQCMKHDTASNLIKMLEKNEDIFELCKTPLLCHIFASHYSTNQQLKPEELMTESLFLEKLVRVVINRSIHEGKYKRLKTLKELDRADKELFSSICTHAYSNFPHQDFCENDLMDDDALVGDRVHKLGLLSINHSKSCDTIRNRTYTFMHRSILEFCAAYHIVDTFDSAQNINTEITVMRAENVWKYVCGILHIYCKSEATRDKLITTILTQSQSGVQKLRYACETQVVKLRSELHLEMNASTMKIKITTHSDYMLLSKVWEDCSFPSLGELSLSNVPVGDKEAITISGALKSTNLKSLQLSHCQLGDGQISHLCDAIKTIANLDTIIFSYNSIKDDGAVKVSKALLEMKVIQLLDLSRNNICDDGAKSVAENLVEIESLKYFE